MARTARFVLPGVPHHLTQRGNRRSRVFFCDADYRTYLRWLEDYSTRHGVEILAYCLMTNHVHMVAVPRTSDSLQLAFGRLHRRYAQNLNHHRSWLGHVWQGRYYSSALDEPHCWAAIRYVELNPVRAGLVSRAEDYPWSSAGAHCGLRGDATLSRNDHWLRQINAIDDWSRWLAAGEELQRVADLRSQTRRCMPCGSVAFIDSLEATTGRTLRPRPRGRPWRRCNIA